MEINAADFDMKEYIGLPFAAQGLLLAASLMFSHGVEGAAIDDLRVEVSGNSCEGFGPNDKAFIVYATNTNPSRPVNANFKYDSVPAQQRFILFDAKIDPTAAYDDQAHTVSYTVLVTEGVQYHYNTMVLTGLSVAGEKRLQQMWPTQAGAVFDKTQFEQFLTKLQSHPADIFGDLPVHYDTVGHWLRTDADKHSVDVLLDFK